MTIQTFYCSTLLSMFMLLLVVYEREKMTFHQTLIEDIKAIEPDGHYKK